MMLMTSVVLLALNLLMAVQLSRAKAESAYLSATITDLEARIPDPIVLLQSRLLGRQLPPLEFPRIHGDETATFHSVAGASSRRWHIVILFSPFDCLECFREVPFWSELGNLAPDELSVIGVATGQGTTGMREFIGRENVEIPVLLDAGGELFKELQVETGIVTPLKLLVTPHGLVVGAHRTTFDDATAQEEYAAFVRSIVIASNDR